MKPPKVVQSQAWRLNTLILGVADAYTDKLEVQLVDHKCTKKLVAAHIKQGNKQEIQQKVDAVNKMATQCMAHAKKKCQRIKSGQIPFSPESALWIHRTQVYRSIIWYQ